ncbi:hypothetical protein Stsp02_18360 [Streptomyces sp. NBRC 14336]|nr:hypothetical protein Stsp02_18360 [Streptomyces sp. NBRC 14336]
MAAPTDGVGGPDVTAGIPGIEGEHASTYGALTRHPDRLMGAIGNSMEPNRVSIRLFVNVVRSPYGVAEVTEVQVQV